MMDPLPDRAANVQTPTDPDPRPAPGRIEAVQALALAVVAALLVLFFFAPRFVYWRSLEVGQWLGGAETHRAFSTLEQLRDPWAPVTSPANVVIAWRLLFPLLWHYLNLPDALYLALPHIGCALVLWLVASLTYKRLADWRQAFLLTALVAASPWYFVSTGWLTYFDSWLVLGLLAASLSPSRNALAAACILTPWVDERFVLALPLTCLVRMIVKTLKEEDTRGTRLVDIAVMLSASLPYPLIRTIAWWRGESLAPTYVAYHLEHIREVPWSRFLEGLWSGFRAGWVMLAAAVWLVKGRLGRAWGSAFGGVVTIGVLAGLTIAADMSRTLAIEVPVLILGAWLWHEADPNRFRRVLPMVLLANLLLPAEHVLWLGSVPIRYLYAQIDEYRNPPAAFQPTYYVSLGNAARQRGDRDGARGAYDLAVRLDPRFAPAYIARAALRIEGRDGEGARSDIAAVLAQSPDDPDALFLRAVLARAQGQTSGVSDDLRRALAVAPPDWAWRGEATRLLGEVPGGATTPGR